MALRDWTIVHPAILILMANDETVPAAIAPSVVQRQEKSQHAGDISVFPKRLATLEPREVEQYT